MSYAYLDIETSWERTITIIGVYRPGMGTTQLVAPRITRERLMETLEGVSHLFTYNGSGFDLPVIQKHLAVNLHQHLKHRDLMFDCWRHKLKGGLKVVERKLGIHRDSEGIDGIAAMRLWSQHRKACETMQGDLFSSSCCEALETLLRYNKEDCENLETLANKLHVHPLLVRTA